MKRRLAVFASAALLAFGSLAATAQEDMRTEQVRFAAGTTGTTLSDTITGREFVVYEIGAEAGQRMLIRLNSDNASTYFNVYEPGRGPGDEALAVSEQTGPMVPDLNVFDGQLPTSGTYSVSVYLYATRRARDRHPTTASTSRSPARRARSFRVISRTGCRAGRISGK